MSNNAIKNFKYLNELIHSGAKEIVLDSDIVLADEEESQYLNGIKLDVDDLAIDGNGHAIDARGLTRIFFCTGKNVTIKNIILKNGFTKEDGGAIHNRDELKITESTLNNNTAGNDGGAIYSRYGSLTISKSTLNNNVAHNGGAIHNRDELKITESTFNENIANEKGMDIFNNGQMFTGENISKIIQIHNEHGKCYHFKLLKNNQKDFTYLNELINSETNEIKLENDIVLNIENNEQKTFEIGIEIDRDNLVIDGNRHTIDAQDLTRIFYCTGKNITIKNIILKNGYVESDGGAIYNKGELTITGSTLNNNKSKWGGAIYNDKGELTITSSTLSGNTATYDGGAIHNYKGELTITGSTLNNNTAKTDGGAIRNSGELTVTESTFNENTAQGTNWYDGGGAIDNSSELTIIESTLINNTAQGGGGAIHNRGELTITESTLTGNTAYDGGAIYSGNKIHMNNCILINNLQSSFSFVENNNKYDIEWNDDFISSDKVIIYLDNKCDGEYRIEDNLIECNKTLSKGSHEIILELNDNNKIIMNFTYSPDVITANVKSYVELINSIDEAKHVIAPQHIINLNKGDYNAKNTIIWNPISNSNLIINGNGITLNGQNTCQFIKIGTNTKLTLNNIILTNYTAIHGGAIHNMGELTIIESTLSGNTATYDGGAIYNSGELTITGSTLNNNKSEWGGAIYNDKGELTITSSTLSGNTVTYYNGGAIYNGEGNLTITESTLTENTARYGGAINNWKGELTIIESTLNNNTAKEDGGAIYNDEGELTITESTLNNNIAQRNGGAIYLYNATIYESNNCTFKDNKPDDVYEGK